jgi:hypothetical protein
VADLNFARFLWPQTALAHDRPIGPLRTGAPTARRVATWQRVASDLVDTETTSLPGPKCGDELLKCCDVDDRTVSALAESEHR